MQLCGHTDYQNAPDKQNIKSVTSNNNCMYILLCYEIYQHSKSGTAENKVYITQQIEKEETGGETWRTLKQIAIQVFENV